jgi:hypothetical protein
MTKEGLLVELMLNQACCKTNNFVRKDFTEEIENGSHDYALNAMDEWAIQFGKWLQTCHYAPATEGNKWQNQLADENDIITTEELYQLFLKLNEQK